jgi:hypothetical protein
MTSDVYGALARRGGDWARLIANLQRIEEAVGSITFEPFFEPVSPLEPIEGAKNQRLMFQRLRSISAGHLTAWTRHIAYGTIARLGSLTKPCLSLLAEDAIVIAGLVERCMLEHAARAAHALEELRKGSEQKSWEPMREVIPKALFGTCLTDPQGTMFEHLEEVTAQRPAKPSKLIDSLEAFAGFSGTDPQTFFPGLYAFLCDLTHPSQRANSGFCRTLEDTGDGWFLKYESDEERKDDATMGAMRGAMRCLQAGYGASALLLSWDFDDDSPGFVATAPEQARVEWIWEHILDPHLVFW